MLRRTRLLLTFAPALFGLALGSCDSGVEVVLDDTADEEVDGSALTEAEEEEVTASFNSAACYCQRFLNVDLAGSKTDPQIGAFELGDLWSESSPLGTCTLGPGSPRSRFPTPSERLGGENPAVARTRNACAEAHAAVGADQGGSQTENGLCLAEVNYCIGQELRLKLGSLARAPSSAAVAAEIARQARDRLDRASLEWTASLRFFERFCPGTVGGGMTQAQVHQCVVLEADDQRLGSVLTARMATAVEASIELALDEVEIRASMADALSFSENTPSEIVQRTWSAGGSRFQAAEAVAGALSGSISSGGVYTSNAESDRSSWDHPFAGQLTVDDRARELLALMVQYAVPVSVASTTGARQPRPYAITATLPATATPTAIFNLLDHRIAAARFESIYAEDLNASDPASTRGQPLRELRPSAGSDFIHFADAGNALPAHESPLRALGFSPSDVQASTNLAFDLLTTTWIDWEASLQVTDLEGFDLYAIRTFGPRRRPILPLTTALARDNFHHADASGRVGRFGEITSLAMEREYYELDPSRIATIGAAGRMHLLRVHLRRALSTGSGTRDYFDRPVLTSIVGALDRAVGGSWTETNRLTVPSYVCPGSTPLVSTECRVTDGTDCRYCGTSPVWSTSPDLRWTVYYDRDDAHTRELFESGGTPVVARSAADVRCLLFGTAPGESGTACTSDAEPLALDASATGSVIGIKRQSYIIPYAEEYTGADDKERAWILWRSADGTRHTLVDLVHPATMSEVHAHAGVFGRAMSDLLAYDAAEPGLPELTALGVESRLVPPLENEITSDGDGLEDSWATYVSDALEASSLATELLTEARTEEIRLLREGREDEIDRESAELEATGTLAEICGTAAGPDGCPFPPSSSATLGELGLVPAPGPAPVLPTATGTTCAALTPEIVATGLRLDGSAEAWPGDLRNYLLPIIECVHWRARRDASAIVVHELPEPVRIALLDPNTVPEFTAYEGAQREMMLVLHAGLADIRESFRQIASEIGVAVAQVGVDGANMGTLTVADWRINACITAHVFNSLGSVVSGAGQTYDAVTYARDTHPDKQKWTGHLQAGSDAAQGSGRMVDGVQSATQISSCAGGNAQAASVASQATINVATTMSRLTSRAFEARDAVGSAVTASASLRAMVRASEMAIAERRVATSALAADTVEDSPAYLALSTVTRRRADAALRRARIATFVARRAMESRLGEDLRALAMPEAYVPPPSAWESTIHLLPWATERASTWDVFGAPLPPGPVWTNVAAESLEDHALHLYDFGRGYAFSRPFTAGEDTVVLDVLAAADDSGRGVGVRVLFFCSESDKADVVTWPPTEGLPCTDPQRVEIAFDLRVDGLYVRDRITQGNFNHRIQSFAVNLVGAGLIDCDRALNPRECLTGGYMRYDLTASGRTRLVSSSGDRRFYDYGTGRVVSGRALAAERFLGTPLSTVDRALIDPYRRVEFRGRPFEADYTLVIEGRPEMRWDRLEGAQLVMTYRHWSLPEEGL